MTHQVISPFADVYGAPDTKAPRGKLETQLVYGETFIVEEEKNGWCKGKCAHDGYPGHIENRHLAKSSQKPTHVVTAAHSHIYSDKTIKSPVIMPVSFGSLVCATEVDENWIQTTAGWIYAKHLSALYVFDNDIIATAKKFLETPYYWGGRSGFGIDCSGLVQICLARAGITTPRDTEDQEKETGKPVESRKPGDIVFFPGHVGIMVDEQNIIHANAHHMKVTIESLDIVAGRSKGLTAIRRL